MIAGEEPLFRKNREANTCRTAGIVTERTAKAPPCRLRVFVPLKIKRRTGVRYLQSWRVQDPLAGLASSRGRRHLLALKKVEQHFAEPNLLFLTRDDVGDLLHQDAFCAGYSVFQR